jgi:hypothetical protein
MPRFQFEETCTSRPVYQVDADNLEAAIAALLWSARKSNIMSCSKSGKTARVSRFPKSFGTTEDHMPCVAATP